MAVFHAEDARSQNRTVFGLTAMWDGLGRGTMFKERTRTRERNHQCASVHSYLGSGNSSDVCLLWILWLNIFRMGVRSFNPIQEQFFSVTAPLRCNKKGGGVLFFVLVESTHMTQHASLPLSHLLLAWFSPVVYPTSPR